MATASTSPPRANLRDILRVKAVDSFLRNFCEESSRLQELLEITLSYGISCASRNFQLKGVTVEELRSITKFDQIKNQDVFVRNATKLQRVAAPECLDPQQLFSKPPQTWRAGDDKFDIFGKETRAYSSSQFIPQESAPSDVYFIPNEAHRDSLDGIDFYSRVLGKAFIDVAWSAYSSRGSMHLDSQQLNTLMTRMDQRKRSDLILRTEFPVCSFIEFLNAYVKTSVATVLPRNNEVAEEAWSVHRGDEIHHPKKSEELSNNPHPSSNRSVTDMLPETHKTKRTNLIPAATRVNSRRLPTSLQGVQSKIGRDVQARKEMLSRVKKTQAQMMKESLARARLAEYEANHRAGSVKQPSNVKRMPLDKITPGAAALEIADKFVRSPLMDKFSDSAAANFQQPSSAARIDPLKEELYGLAAHDASFLGRPTPPENSAPRKRNLHPTPTRDYRGWLGDFGPQHTKTIQPTWGTDKGGSGPSAGHDGSSDGESQQRSQLAREFGSRNDRYEWKFELLGEPKCRRMQFAPNKTTARGGDPVAAANSISSSDTDVPDGEESEISDPVYNWLKTAMH